MRVEAANLLVQRSVAIARELQAAGGEFVIENPALDAQRCEAFACGALDRRAVFPTVRAWRGLSEMDHTAVLCGAAAGAERASWAELHSRLA